MSSIPSNFTGQLPPSLNELAGLYWQGWEEACAAQGIDPLSIPGQRVAKVWACSDFVARLCIRRPAVFLELLEQSIDETRSLAKYHELVEQALANVDGSDNGLMAALRLLRQKEMLRIAWRDLEGLATVEQTLHDLSDFAEAIVSVSLEYIHSQSIETLGEPRSPDDTNQKMLVLAMGKLGGRELNFSSDIDLIFFYAEDGETDGRVHLSNHEFFTRQARKLVKVLSEVTQEGFVFRVDTRLRPYGESGPLVMSFAAMEQYYQSQGRDWERYAMIKARVITGNEEDQVLFYDMLKPFVYRRYLDYSAFESIRSMKSMIDAEVKRKGFKDNIKLGYGGIREIEFIGQAFQLLRGGHDKALQARGIMEVLKLQGEMRLLNAGEVEQLQQAYRFLRKLENTIQMERDSQTHSLPVDEKLRQKLSLAMGYDDWKDLSVDIDNHRKNVDNIFQSVFAGDDESHDENEGLQALHSYWLNPDNTSEIEGWLARKEFNAPKEFVQKLDVLRRGGSVRILSEDTSKKLLNLLSKLLVEIASYDNALVLFERVLEILDAIVGRQVYINLLLEYPEARQQMLSLCAKTQWFVQQIVSNPILLDELLDADELFQSKDHQALSEELNYLLSSVDEGDLEQYMDRLRQFKNAQVMKVAVLDVSQVLSVTDVGDTLSDIAVVVLSKVLELAWNDIAGKHGQPECVVNGKTVQPGLGIVAYGKLGGLELGYGSDLDIVFLHNSTGEGQVTRGDKSIDNFTFFSRVAQRVLHILGTRMYSGQLYETDIRLRPEGRSGMMVSSLVAFEQYQLEKAWTWEHQALIRARIVAGNDHVRQEFDRIRSRVLTVQRDSDTLYREVVEMREKMRRHLASGKTDVFDIKQDSGGIVDIEFIVQAGVLLCAGRYPKLLETTSTLVYLDGLEACGWLEKGESALLGQAYREYRDHVNRQALLIEPPGDASDTLQSYRDSVTGIWNRLSGSTQQ